VFAGKDMPVILMVLPFEGGAGVLSDLEQELKNNISVPARSVNAKCLIFIK
jgi:hypothetical protein